MQGEMIYIAVSDNGGGLDESVAGHIFDSFVTSKSGGSGLGLAITKQIAESHHGFLTCESRPGDGCTFTIVIPARQPM
jgi:signal transduction histidine kinase